MAKECLFNMASGVKDEDLAKTIGLTQVGDCGKKCDRCGQKIRFRAWGNKKRLIGFMDTVNRPTGCNGETHP